MPLSDIVNVSITRATQAVPKASFDVIGIFSDECNFVDRTRTYTTLASLASDLIGGTYSYTYKMAAAIMAQNPRVTSFKVLNRIGPKTILFEGTWTAAGSVSVTVNGTVVTQAFSTDKDTSLTALAASIQALAAINGVTFTAVYTNNATTADADYITVTPSGGPCAITAVTVTGITGTLTTAKSGAVQPVTILDDAGTFTAGSIATSVNGTKVTTAWGTAKSNTMTAHAAAILANATLDDLLATAIYVDGSHTITLIPKAGYGCGVVYQDFASLTGTMTAYAKLTGSEAIATALAAINTADAAWYALVVADASSSAATGTAPYFTTDTTLVANQLAFATFAEANTKIYCIASSDRRIVDVALASDTTSIAYQLKNSAYSKSWAFYSAAADTEFPDAAILGKLLPWTPGSYTAKFKTLAGISADSLTSTQVTNAAAKYCMYYIPIAGSNITAEGKVAEGEWIDTIIGIDWQTNLIQTEVYALLVSSKKVPYDDSGIISVANKISNALEQGIQSGLYTAHLRDADGVVIGGYVVTVPKAADVSDNDKNLRTLNSVEFTAYLAGAIHAATISGIITV